MKRYLIFGAIGPFIGGFLLLFATTMASGYWTETHWREVGKAVLVTSPRRCNTAICSASCRR